MAILGRIDEPADQRQEPLELDLERDGGLLVYGGGGSGRTTTLLTLGAVLAASASPDELHLFGLDFGAGGLAPLAQLPHSGGVIPGSDEERVLRLFAMLRNASAERLEATTAAGLSASGSDRRSPLPRLLLLLDGYAAFAAAYEKVQFGEAIELLTRLAADGRSVGIHVAITADRRGSVPSRLASLFARRLVLRLADEAEYAQLGLDRRVIANARFVPGRGFTERGLEAQVAIPGGSSDPAAVRAAVGAVGRAAERRWPGRHAPTIGILPTRIEFAALPPAGGPGRAVIGIGDRSLEPVELDLADGHALVAGPLRSGRSTALAAIAASLSRNPAHRLHLIAPRRTLLADRAGWLSVAQGAEAAASAAEAILAIWRARPSDDGWEVVLVDDAEELFEGPGAAGVLALLRAGRDGRLRVIAAPEIRSRPEGLRGLARRNRARIATGSCSSPVRTSAESSSVRPCHVPRGGRCRPVVAISSCVGPSSSCRSRTLIRSGRDDARRPSVPGVGGG